jgi:hypothetical protein
MTYLSKIDQPNLSLSEALLVITDLFVDAREDGVDALSNREILHFMGFSEELVKKICPSEEIFSIKNLENLDGYMETKQSFKLYEAVEANVLNEKE